MHDQKNGKGQGQREELTRRRVVLGQVPLCEKCAVLPQVHEEVRNHLTQVCLYSGTRGSPGRPHRRRPRCRTPGAYADSLTRNRGSRARDSHEHLENIQNYCR